MIDRSSYLIKLYSYAFRSFPLLYLSFFLALFSVFLEIFAMTILLPISELAQGVSTDNVAGFWPKIFSLFNITFELKNLLLCFCGLFFARVFSQLTSQGLANYLSKMLQGAFSTEGLKGVLNHLTIREIEEKSIGYFMGLCGDEAARAGHMVESLNRLTQGLLLSILYFGAIWVYSPPGGVVLSIFLGITFLSLLSIFKKSQKLGEEIVSEQRNVHSIFLDAINGLRSVKAYNAENYVSNNYKKALNAYVLKVFWVEFLNLFSRLAPVLILFSFLGIGALILSSQDLHQVGLGLITTLIIYHLRLFPTLGTSLNIFLQMLRDAKAGKDVTQILKRSDPNQNLEKFHAIDHEPIQRISFEHIYFSHKKHKPIFKGESFLFEAGKSYAIVGTSGAGKSTLFDLLLKFYPLERGKIYINGHDLDNIHPKNLRSKILVVHQQSVIFNDTLKKNILYGPNEGSWDQKVLHICQLDNLVESLPHGVDTMVNYGGSNFSGGQRQRINLARAILRDPEVLILDESTSALDHSTKVKIIENLRTLYKDKILIFITHDQITCELVDEVISLERKEVHENPQVFHGLPKSPRTI